ncbi:MAG: hypothetical protein GY765_09400 [bacterium]|nr:hypothetical protein [bacterium]
MPGNFGFGLVFGVFWLLILLFFAWNSFNRLWDVETGKGNKNEEIELKPNDFKKGKTTIVLTYKTKLLSTLQDNLSRQKIDYVFVPCPAGVPGDIKVKSLLDFFELPLVEGRLGVGEKYIRSLSPDDRVPVLMEIAGAKKAEFYVFSNFLAGLSDSSVDYFAGFLETLKKGRKIAYFTTNSLAAAKIGNDVVRVGDIGHPAI